MELRDKLKEDLINYIEDWIKRGKPLGFSNPKKAIDIYETEVKKIKAPGCNCPVLKLDEKQKKCYEQ
jgi:hypothetical protein